MTDQEEEMAAQHTALGFLVEVLLARHLAEQSDEDAKQIVLEIAHLGRKSHTNRTDLDPDQAMRVTTRYREIQEQLLEKALVRSLSIRQAQAK